MSINRVAIVGGGPAGTAVAKYLASEAPFKVIDIFEQRSSFGGLWNYSPESANGQTKVPQTEPFLPPEEPIQPKEKDQDPSARKHHSGNSCFEFQTPMYWHLETNIPHFLMQFSDMPSLTENQLFPTREDTLQYLLEYGDIVRCLVKFQTQVTEVLHGGVGDKDSWQVRYRSLGSNTCHENTYDAVVVATGHYSVPYLPEIQGISQWNSTYPGSISHSKFYNHALHFLSKKVLVVGNSASGQDISSQISSVCNPPVMISVRSQPPTYTEYRSPQLKVVMPEIAEFISPSLARRAVKFSDGHVETDIDAIIFCTGYFYSYPFLTSFLPPLISTGERVQNLYQHIFSIHHPSLAFVGLPKPIIPFRTVEGQAAVIARVWSGRLDLPSEAAMHAWEESVIAEQGAGRKFHDLRHPKDFDYYDALIEWALQAREEDEWRKLPPKWSERDRWVRSRMAEVKEAFALAGEARHKIYTMEKLGFFFNRDKLD